MEWTPHKDLRAFKLASLERERRKSERKGTGRLALLCFVGFAVLFIFFVAKVKLNSATAVMSTVGVLCAFEGARKLMSVWRKDKEKPSSRELRGEPLSERQRQLLGLPPRTLKMSSPLSDQGSVDRAKSNRVNLADTPVRYMDVSRTERKAGEAMSRDLTPKMYERTPISAVEGERQISTPEQLDSYLKQLRTSLDRDNLQTSPPPSGVFGSPRQSLSEAAYGYPPDTSITPTLPQYRASPQTNSAVQSPAEKSLASSWEVIERFLGRYGLTGTHLEQSEDDLRQWFSDCVLDSLLNGIISAHESVERAAALPGAACATNITPPPVNVLPLALCPTIAFEDVKGAAKDQDLDKYQLEKWHEVLTAAKPATPGGMGMGSLFGSPAAQSFDPARRQQLVQAIQNYLGLLSVLEGKCPGAKEFLSPFPKGYLLSRVIALSRGGCVSAFKWNSGKSHIPSKKWNRNEFATDSALLCYLFCAYLRHPGWNFEGSVHKSTPRTSLFIGQLPHLPGDHFRAILPQMPAPKSTGAITLLQSRFGNPVYTLCLDAEEELRMTGHSGLFRGLALFLMLLQVTDHGWIGHHRFHNLGLAKVVHTHNMGMMDMMFPTRKGIY